MSFMEMIYIQLCEVLTIIILNVIELFGMQ